MRKILLLLAILGIFVNANEISPNEMINISDIKNKFLDVPYDNNSSAQKLDIYLPNEIKGNAPAIIFIHGGAWLRGDKREQKQLGNAIKEAVKRGYVAVSINYRFSDEAKFPAAIEDCKTAIRYIRANASKYHINPNELAVFGRSVGANMAALIGTTDKEFTTNVLSNISSKVKAVVALFPPINLASMDDELKILNLSPEIRTKGKASLHGDANSPASLYIGDKLSNALDKVKQNNPTTYINENVPAFFVGHGTMDRSIPIIQSINFVNALNAKSKNEVVFIPIVGARHGDPKFFEQDYLNLIFNFLDRNLKK